MVETVTKTTINFKTDIHKKSSRQDHPSGILIAFRSTPSLLAPKEEHCFAWIANPNGIYDNTDNNNANGGIEGGGDFGDVERNTHLYATLAHLERFGFLAKNVKFIPFSSKANWIYKYPHAYPYIECNEVGEVSGYPYWNPATNDPSTPAIGESFHLALGMGRDAYQDNPTCMLAQSTAAPGHSFAANAFAAGGGNVRTDIAAATTATAVAAAASNANANANANANSAVATRGRSVLKAAMLSDKERDQLHLEIYDYFSWLETELAEMDSNYNGRRQLSNAGMVVSGVRNVIARMEGAFRVIRDRDEAEKEASATGSGVPFLEEVLGSALRQRFSHLQPVKKGTHGKAPLDFDDMYAKLLAFRHEHGHVNVTRKYKDDPQLGTWVTNLRYKKKEWDKAMAEENPKRKATAVLDEEKIARLEAIGFEFGPTRDTRNHISWDERLDEVKRYYEQHGTFRVPRKYESLGEWVHKQRQLYNKRDENFMEKKYPKLAAIGFEFTTNRLDKKSWNDRFEELLEFYRLHGHHEVPCPPTAGECDENDPEMEQYRLYKWVKKQHVEYRLYASGQSSRLTHERVQRLNEIGFHFR